MKKFCRLSELASKIGSGQTPTGGYRSYLISGIPLIRSQNVLMGEFSREGLVYISPKTNSEMSSSRVEENDVLLNITGASIGRVCVVPREICPANVNQHVCIVRCGKDLEPDYLALLLASPRFQSIINDNQAGATRQALTKAMIEDFEVPFISLEDQRKISGNLKLQLAEVAAAKIAAQMQLREITQLPRKLLASAFEM